MAQIKKANAKIPNAKIQNVVATADVGHTIDLNSIAREIPSVEYRPELFPGLCLRLKKPKASALIFRTGKMVCTGTKSEKQAKRAVNRVVKRLKEIGILIMDKPKFQVQNIVASGGLGRSVDLERASYVLGRVMYEPEQFPGLIHRMDDPRVVFLIFSNGQIVCTGAKKEPDVYKAVERLAATLEENKLYYEPQV